MKNNGRKKQVNQMRFGEFVAAICAALGRQRGRRMVQLAVNMHLIEFLGEQRFLISEE